jgi:ribosomal protein S18 acetylase RimI-like enzyme
VISVRQFEDGDARELASVMMEMVAFYGRPLAVEGSLPEDIIKQAKNIGMVVALSDDSVAGFATYGFLYPVAGLQSFAYLQQIYIASSHRRLGIAQQLMAFVARVCEERGCAWMEWSTGRENRAARSFYEGLGAAGSEKIGYEITGEALRALAASSGSSILIPSAE